VANGATPNYGSIEWWDAAVLADWTLAATTAAEILADGDRSGDERALAGWALARATFETGRTADAAVAARRAIVLSREAVDASVQHSVVLTAAVILAETGDLDAGLAALDEHDVPADGVEAVRFAMQRAYLLHHAGRLAEAVEHANRADHMLSAVEAPVDRIRLHMNRGLILLQMANLASAETDFFAAIEIGETLGFTQFAALAHGNLGVLYGRSRRLPEALRHFDRASELYGEQGGRGQAIAEIDRAEVLIHAGMVADAVDAARAAVRMIEPTGNTVMLGDAELMVARAELAAGNGRAALRAAEQAQATFVSSGRHEMTAHARALVALAGLAAAASTDAAATAIAASDAVATALRADGWADQADALTVAAIRTGYAFGLGEAIAGAIEFLRKRVHDDRRDVALAGWYAEGVHSTFEGDHAGALDACRAGLAVVDAIVAEAPDLERRSAATRIGSDLGALALDAAVAAGDADLLLRVAEATRARALAAELAGPDAPGASGWPAGLVARVAPRLAGRALVMWLVSTCRVRAIVLDGTDPRTVDVASLDEVVRARDRVVRWLDEAGADPTASSAAGRRAAGALDELLLAPLDLAPDSGAVLVPVDALHGVPWAALPRMAGRSFCEVPSIGMWLAADRRAAQPAASTGAVIGPDVAGGSTERQALTSAYPKVAIAGGPGATSGAVRTLLGTCDAVHLAAHGSFRADRPLMSSLRLADGEAVLAEVLPERLAAQLVVLSSCEGGAQGTAGGSEVLGLAALLLARGSAAVVAPLTVVCDLECAEFVAELHAELAAGTPVGAALASVRRRWLASDVLGRWAVAASFACFGSASLATR